MPLPGQPDDIPTPPDGFDYSDFHWSPLGHLTTKYVWNTWGDNCPICNAMQGKVYTMDFWINAGIHPGFHPGCDCTLKKVADDTISSDPDFFGMNVPQFADMFLPGPNIFWDPKFKIQPWQNSIVADIDRMASQSGSSFSFSEIFKKLGGDTFFSQRPKFYGDTVGWRVLETQRYFENIDGSHSGSKYITFKNLFYILEPFWIWFKRRWKTRSVYNFNKRYSEMKRIDTPLFPKPSIPKPWLPFQNNYTEF